VGKDYIEAIESSVNVAGYGVAYADDVINLCDHLVQELDADIGSFIEEMRRIVQLAHVDAQTTYGLFRTIRQKLHKVC
jgi:hypothetical protein